VELNRLGARTVKTINTPGRHSDGGGLYLSIKNGGKSWLFLYRDRVSGKLKEMGLGSFEAVPLAEARQKAAAARLQLSNGEDPLAAKKAERAKRKKAKNFGDYCDTFLVSALAGFENKKHRDNWRATVTKDAAALRPMMVSAITTEDVRRVLEPIWTTKNETARRLRQRLERIFEAAKAEGLRTGDNPAAWRGNLKPFFGTQKRRHEHYSALPYPDMHHFINDLRSRDGMSALALEWTILTAARTGETRFATWDEIDFDKACWIIPANRMKARRIHRVPLTAGMLSILNKLKPKNGKTGGYIFKSTRGKPLSDSSMLECLKDVRHGLTVHGFRSTFRDWCYEETSFSGELAKKLLHTATKMPLNALTSGATPSSAGAN
jgi:integrase